MPLPRLDVVRVLAVDDDDETRSLVKAVLGSCGAEVSVAASIQEALAALVSAYVDVVVSDIGMAGSDGCELVRQLREREQLFGGQIPAVALTAYAGDDSRERALAAGFQHHVAKPVTPAALAETVAKAVGRPVVAW